MTGLEFLNIGDLVYKKSIYTYDPDPGVGIVVSKEQRFYTNLPSIYTILWSKGSLAQYFNSEVIKVCKA